jgi:tRNA (cytidine/uridine-2'-O-)-methyltransferase
MRLALYQPDMAANAGTMLRLAACLGVAADIIEPCGFPFSIPAFRRAGMDYLQAGIIEHHLSFAHFSDLIQRATPRPRVILLSTKATQGYTEMIYRRDDILMVGREGGGVPEDVHRACDERVLIPMMAGLRSLNVAVAAAMVLGEALRQTGQLPR